MSEAAVRKPWKLVSGQIASAWRRNSHLSLEYECIALIFEAFVRDLFFFVFEITGRHGSQWSVTACSIGSFLLQGLGIHS
ncbi:hypothetical protein T01_5470 [Trichinella spiralis]|uniref:Uncharacterized protein n=1 Tax=Trichinella spiralis TaxID=6334 RepID=A0A0V1A0N3_TRISP|nr:hypothetical protein T01_5470 [Trichinella spiralis]